MRGNISASERESIRDGVAEIVRRLVKSYARAGMKNEQAMEVTARKLGITPRRVKAYVYGEVYSIPAHEAAGIVEGWRRSSEARIEALRAEIAAEQSNIKRLEARCADVSELLRVASEVAR